MPLSEHEQRLLDEIERALYAEDPKFASAVRQTDLASHLKRRIRRAALLLVLGAGALVAGAATTVVPLGVAGFVIMLVAALVIGRSAQRLAHRDRADAATSTVVKLPRRRGRAPKGSQGSWKERIEERWKRRWEDRD